MCLNKCLHIHADIDINEYIQAIYKRCYHQMTGQGGHIRESDQAVEGVLLTLKLRCIRSTHMIEDCPAAMAT